VAVVVEELEEVVVVPLVVEEVVVEEAVEGLVVESSLVEVVAVLPPYLCCNYNCNCMAFQEGNSHQLLSLIEIQPLLVA